MLADTNQIVLTISDLSSFLRSLTYLVQAILIWKVSMFFNILPQRWYRDADTFGIRFFQFAHVGRHFNPKMDFIGVLANYFELDVLGLVLVVSRHDVFLSLIWRKKWKNSFLTGFAIQTRHLINGGWHLNNGGCTFVLEKPLKSLEIFKILLRHSGLELFSDEVITNVSSVIDAKYRKTTLRSDLANPHLELIWTLWSIKTDAM